MRVFWELLHCEILLRDHRGGLPFLSKGKCKSLGMKLKRLAVPLPLKRLLQLPSILFMVELMQFIDILLLTPFTTEQRSYLR